MVRAVGVVFRQPGKMYWFDPGSFDLHVGDAVIVETSRGKEMGIVRTPPSDIPDEWITPPLRPVLRVATEEDKLSQQRFAERARDALRLAAERVRHFGLPMKLVDAEYAFDGSQVTIYFTAESRVDFRELVRDLACRLRARVQLHQIGARDHTRMLGGYGPCGRELCCCAFLSEFAPVSMRMAKDQSLFLNPVKFSGTCGKLMCCLRYEHEFYAEARSRLPALGTRVVTPHGTGEVVGVSVLNNEVTVQLPETAALVTCKPENIQVIDVPQVAEGET